MDQENLARLRRKYAGQSGGDTEDPVFQKVAERMFVGGTRTPPYAGIPTFLSLPYRHAEGGVLPLDGLQVAAFGVPMDQGVTNRTGSRFGPRAVRTIERIGPFNHALRVAPGLDLRAADIGDIPFRSRFNLEESHRDIEDYVAKIVAAGVVPLAVGGDHSISYPILRAIGASRPVALVHIDAHCDTSGPFDMSRFHHAGPFRQAVLDGVVDPRRTIQIGIRGASEYLWEFSTDSGMTVIHAEDVVRMGTDAVVERARAVVGDGPVYLTFDIDSLDPAFAPGTGTPEVGGLSTREAQAILRGLKGLDLVGADLVEVAPQYDPSTNTAQAGAQVLFEIFSLMVFSQTVQRAG
jgi:agmatinase